MFEKPKQNAELKVFTHLSDLHKRHQMGEQRVGQMGGKEIKRGGGIEGFELQIEGSCVSITDNALQLF